MNGFKIVRRRRLTRRASHELIQAFARYGNHDKLENFVSEAQVKRAFAINEIEYDELVEKCRDPAHHVPFFENLIGSTWTVSPGSSVSRVNLNTGEEDNKVDGPGLYAPDGYWATYETAHGALERAANNLSYGEALSALSSGIASIETFLRARVLEWNKNHPDDQLIDSRDTKVSFDDKIDLWIPKMTGRKLDKSGKRWQAFKVARAIRDDHAVHPKEAGHAVQFARLVEIINLFANGIAGLLIDLHIHFKQKTPRIIIRDAYAPEAELVTEESFAD
jgi:hypothetical protein